MSKCNLCRVDVLDATQVCPLCKSIIAPDALAKNRYPAVRIRLQRLALANNIYLFLALCAEAILLFINGMTTPDFWWSVIPGVALLYVYLVLRYAIQGRSGYRSKILVLALLAILSTIAIDVVIGYKGWSVDYVLPSGIAAVDVIILICMIVNHRNWQSYIIWQLFMILCSLLPVVLYLTGLEHNRYLAFVPLAASLALFLGTLIIGDRRARLELSRRFHF